MQAWKENIGVVKKRLNTADAVNEQIHKWINSYLLSLTLFNTKSDVWDTPWESNSLTIVC